MLKISTFSIVACDISENSWGVAVVSRYLAVGAIVPYAKAGVGALATQSIGNPLFGQHGLTLLSQGVSASEVLSKLLENDNQREDRQLGIVDAQGQAVTFTGKNCDDWAGGLTGKGYAVQGNTLVDEATVAAMAQAFEASQGELADRLYAALLVGDKAGGDWRGKQSAALLVAKPLAKYAGKVDRYVDLRVDDYKQPVKELGRLLDLHHLFLGSSKPEDKIKINQKLAKELQDFLWKINFYKGEISGDWDVASGQALFNYLDRENLEDRLDIEQGLIDPPALEYIRAVRRSLPR